MQLPTPTLLPIPPGTIHLADYERHAQARMDANAWAYFSGGAADELSLRANSRAWQEIALAPRVLRPMLSTQKKLPMRAPRVTGITWCTVLPG